MPVIFEENDFKLFSHDRQLRLFETSDGKMIQYQLKEILFDNFKRKQKIKSKQSEESKQNEKVQEFLRTCKGKSLFPSTDEACKDGLKAENIELMNKFHKIVNDFGAFHGENNLNHGKVFTLNDQVYLIPPKCKFFCKRIEEIESCLEPNEANKFDFIVIDPPWTNRYIKRVKQASKGYFTMSDDDIAAIPLEKYVKPTSIVVIWCTNSDTHKSAVKDKILQKWRLKLLSTWQWMKVDKDGELFCSIDGNKKPYETVFIATHKDNISYDKELETETVCFSQPSSVHSHKPPMIDLFNKFLPTNPKCLEIFARSLYENFTSIGLEVIKLQNAILFDAV